MPWPPVDPRISLLFSFEVPSDADGALQHGLEPQRAFVSAAITTAVGICLLKCVCVCVLLVVFAPFVLSVPFGTFLPASSFVFRVLGLLPASFGVEFASAHHGSIVRFNHSPRQHLDQSFTFFSIISCCCFSLCFLIISSRFFRAAIFCFCFSSRLYNFISY